MIKILKNLITDEEGQGLAEYGLILALIAVVCIIALSALGGQIRDKLDEVKTGIETGTTG